VCGGDKFGWALVEVSSISALIHGFMTSCLIEDRISFPSLDNVELKLSFDTQLPWASKGYPRDPAPIDIELPALRRVGGLSLEGDIRRFVLPPLNPRLLTVENRLTHLPCQPLNAQARGHR
jgi:hypothetical protein